MTTTTLERTEGLSVLNQAMAAIKERIEEKRGVFNIQMEVSQSIDVVFDEQLIREELPFLDRHTANQMRVTTVPFSPR